LPLQQKRLAKGQDKGEIGHGEGRFGTAVQPVRIGQRDLVEQFSGHGGGNGEKDKDEAGAKANHHGRRRVAVVVVVVDDVVAVRAVGVLVQKVEKSQVREQRDSKERTGQCLGGCLIHVEDLIHARDDRER
jgi:hypothetical protein